MHLLAAPPKAGRIGQMMQRLDRGSSFPVNLVQRERSVLKPHP
nr:hypothetical protein [Xanthomonas hyacinthi]